MKKVLIITYYWPPAGGGGVQRWLKFVKYLPLFGYEPIVYIPENPDYPNEDTELLSDVSPDLTIIKGKIFEPNQILNLFKKPDKKHNNYLSQGKKHSLISRLLVFIRANFFIPDARMLWIKPSVKTLVKYLSNNKVDVIVSTGPPFSCHLIGHSLHQITKIPWLVDCRDAWSQAESFIAMPLSENSKRKHIKLEIEVLNNASIITTVGYKLAEDLNKLTKNKIEVIQNGYDHEDFENLTPIKVEGKFIISYIGSMLASQNPTIIWDALGQLLDEYKEFESKFHLNMIGTLDESVHLSIAKSNFQHKTNFERYVPHSKAIGYQLGSDILILSINKSTNNRHIITGKVFEYMYTGKPILCIGPLDGEIAMLFKDLHNACVYDYGDLDGVKQFILNIFKNQKDHKPKNIDMYTRVKLTEKLAKIMDSILI